MHAKPASLGSDSGASAARTDPEERFWSLAEALLAQPGVTRSTMMGLPCLRVDQKFFASLDRRTGSLVVKLSRAEVEETIGSGQGERFAPAGKAFREWLAIPPDDHERWPVFLTRAKNFVGGAAAS